MRGKQHVGNHLQHRHRPSSAADLKLLFAIALGLIFSCNVNAKLPRCFETLYRPSGLL